MVRQCDERRDREQEEQDGGRRREAANLLRQTSEAAGKSDAVQLLSHQHPLSWLNPFPSLGISSEILSHTNFLMRE